MEDMESANMAVLLIVMFGYLVSCIAVPFSTETGNSAVAIIVSLFPIVSIFCAPVQYICGNISIYILLLSWLIQVGLITLLAVFCSRVYEGLVIHKGSRVKLKELLSMAGLRKAKEVQE
jgi:ABC-type Na+ efflux pump permease subunit